MALPTQPNGSSDVRVQGAPALAATAQQLTQTSVTELILNQLTGTKAVPLTESTTVLIIN